MSKVAETGEGAVSAVRSDRRREAIGANVLAALGRPPELIRVSVVPLWGDKFRVNVWAAGSNGASIPDSYFVTADGAGAVLTSEPPIRKQY
jgi:hypothetical protein